MINLLYGVTAFLYGLFVIRFVLSWVLGEFDLDADADADVDADVDTDLDSDTDSGFDLSLSDLVSFKGATHFGMGFFGWLSSKQYLTNHIEWYDWLIAFLLGLIFVIVLYFIYKLMLKLETKPEILSGKRLIGAKATIYLVLPEDTEYYKYVITVNNGVGTVEVTAKSKVKYSIGDVTKIVNFENEVYLI